MWGQKFQIVNTELFIRNFYLARRNETAIRQYIEIKRKVNFSHL